MEALKWNFNILYNGKWTHSYIEYLALSIHPSIYLKVNHPDGQNVSQMKNHLPLAFAEQLRHRKDVKEKISLIQNSPPVSTSVQK